MNIVAVLAHVFHISHVGLLFLVSTPACFQLLSLSLLASCLTRTLSMHQTNSVPKSPIPFTSLNVSSPNGSGPDLDGWMCGRSGPALEQQLKELRDISGPLVRGFAAFESHVKTISNSVVLLTSRITNVEQIVSARSAKMVAFETAAAPPFSENSPLP